MSLYSDIYEFMILQGTELHRGNQWYFVIWQQDLDLCFSVTDGLGMASLAMYLRLACQHSWTPMGRGAHYIDSTTTGASRGWYRAHLCPAPTPLGRNSM